MPVPDAIKDFIENAKRLGSDGLTVSEFGELLMSLLKLAVQIADGYQNSGAEKKLWVLNLVGVLFDEVADGLVPIYLKPFWLMFRSGVRALVISLASGAIESILPLVRAAA